MKDEDVQYNKTLKSILFLVVHKRISWFSVHTDASVERICVIQNEQVQTLKHTVILLFMCKVASGSPAITLLMVANLLIRAISMGVVLGII